MQLSGLVRLTYKIWKVPLELTIVEKRESVKPYRCRSVLQRCNRGHTLTGESPYLSTHTVSESGVEVGAPVTGVGGLTTVGSPIKN